MGRIAAAGTAIAVLLAVAPSGQATHLGYKRCGDTVTPRVRAAQVQSNFGCRHAHTTLRTLLAHGVHGLPKPTTRAGRWGCRNTGFKHFYNCERRYSSPGINPASVVFQAHARRR
jgi:hypothetical protein